MRARVITILLAVLVILGPMATPCVPADPDWPPVLTIVTASPGGTYHVYGAGLARILSRALNMPVAERITEGPDQNIRMIEAGEAQLGFITIGAALQAWNGTAEWTEGKRYRSIRALFPMYDTPFHFVVLKDSPIRSIAAMAGGRIGVGPQGGTSGTYIPMFLKALKIEASLAHGTWDELAADLSEGKLDALAAAVGAPFPAIAGLEAKRKIAFVEPSGEEILALRTAMHELTPSTIPPGVYPSLNKPYRSVGLFNFAVAGKDLPDSLAYAIVDAVFANRQSLTEVHPAAAETVPANLIHNTFLPYHPGASRYYSNRFMSETVRGD
ncbi:MAG: TAXI family TRAP transporter solute-binding subunit [Desulfobacteraceae bacterium]|nr:TAXI family TRAP transporter solute-binding subunit [Desulfobacteraceae bacterium]